MTPPGEPTPQEDNDPSVDGESMGKDTHFSPQEHPGRSDVANKLAPQTNNRGHLLRLYPVFCECIGIEDQGIRQTIVRIMKLVGVEFGIMTPPPI
eukprot:CAMPEP_0167798204 /NCGR_PEP_ID=MMETSP0111_2-20121227/16161_1 /TAXON_ID=91324 /ORGANISM="Lotharella globosa, Strain CCCM811" /LENGTH=94 /DNA_ID=CAMNT_0007692557 /DNA_START=218 /DNA_END=502 /DNA_ORIENTATION=+